MRLLIDSCSILLTNSLTHWYWIRDGTTSMARYFPGELRTFSWSGSPGGSRIINYVTQTIVGLIDWQLDMQQAMNIGHVTNRNDYTSLEKGMAIEKHAEALKKRGHDVRVMDLNSGLHGITINPDGTLTGGADPRREGTVKGE